MRRSSVRRPEEPAIHVHAPAHAENAPAEYETTRKPALIAQSLANEPIPGVTVSVAEPAEESLVTEMHDHAYIEAVRTGDPSDLAESNGLDWSEELYPAVLASTGAVMSSLGTALDDGRGFGLAAGLHHARAERGSGFCTVNGLALAAVLSAQRGLEVVVIDLDAHFGGGTQSIVGELDSVRQLDVSTSAFDSYAPTSQATPMLVGDAGEYLATVRLGLTWLEHGPRPDIVLYNAGVDPHEDCPTGGLRGLTTATLAERDALVADWAVANGLPIAAVLAGGYEGARLDTDDLVGLHRNTIAALAAA
ncbi:hypothetical protein [Rhabdothermincola salaria]|uniref:hypothetical protein n=1 Tax=Rhabdothermincola salaria TaxID=2903142 RepID=UPI003211C488